MKVGFVSLGCSKNLVVTESLIGMFVKHGYEVVNDPEDAEILVINTCGFIESAKEEGINTILEMADYKERKCKYLIVIGCLVQRYKEELKKELPEVDLFVSIKEYDHLWNLISNLVKKKDETDFLNFMDRYITTGNTTAYLKIAEGCSNCCAYCAIPLIQGRYISRPFESIIEEAKKLADNGYREIVVIAQDTTKYGIDLYGKERLTELLHELSKIDGIHWIRFLYSYPESITDELIEEVKNNDKICNYFDMPIQHISDGILDRMNRKTNHKEVINKINKIRKSIPNVIIRTTLIAGFPGETEEDYNKLCNFVKEYRIDKLGCFAYSKEDHTAASYMDNQISKKEKTRRANNIMKIQKKVSKEVLGSKIGNTYEVLLESVTDDMKYFVGRTYMDVPDEDGIVYIPFDNNHLLDDFYNIKIVDTLDYDLIAEFI